MKVNHGSRDVECGVALILHTVHVLKRVSRKSVDKHARGVGFSHILNLHETKTTAINQLQKETRREEEGH